MKTNLTMWISNWLARRSPAGDTTAIQPPPAPQSCPPATNLDNPPWLTLVEDNTALLNELDEMLSQLDPAARPLAEHVKTRLQEILERSGVARIENETNFDIARHQAWPPVRAPQGAPIAATIEPGLAVGPRVFRRARVRLAG